MEEKKYLDYQGLQTYHENLLSVLEHSELATAEALDDLDDRLKIIENKSPYSKSEIDLLLTPITNKLENIEEFAEVNVQSDWNLTDTTADDYIKNKPTIPSVGNAVIEILKNGTKVGSFTTNQSGSKVSVNITVPTGTAANKDVPISGNADTSLVVMGNDSRLTDSRNANDVYSWAKASSKPTYTASEVGAIPTSEKGAKSGVATLDSAGKVPASQLPSYVDDVLEYDTKSKFPTTGEAGKIYVDKSTNTTWRWSGSAYTQIKGDLVIGTTTGTAADGGVASSHYSNTSNPHSVTKAQVGLGSVVNTGDSATPVSGGTTKFTTGGAYTELNKKVDKVSGKGLSTNDYTTDEKNKLSGIASGAQANVIETVKVNGTALTPSSKAVNVTVPTKTSELTNNSNFVSDASYVHTDNNYTATEKSKLSGIASGAEVNQNAFSNVGVKVGNTTTTVAADAKTDTVTLIQGSNVTLTADTTNDTVTIAAKDTTYSAATTSAAGLMSADDKTKLNGIAAGAEVNVQSDWNATEGDAFIKNKPTIPSEVTESTVSGWGFTKNAGTITGIKMNGASKGTSGVVDLGTVITAHQDISGKADKSATVSSVAYNTTSKKITKTINGTTSDVVTAAKIVTDGGGITSHQDISGKADKTTTVNGHALSSDVTVTKSDVGLGNVTNDSQVKRSEMGAASGVATLDSNGKVPSSQLPSYVDDVIEGYFYNSKFYKESAHTTEITGETGKIYVDLSTNKTYRWGGSAYAVISETLALGETSSTAYRGDRGKTAYTHSQTTSGNPHNVTKSDVGLGNVGNFKAVSTVASQGLTDTEKSNARTNIGAGTSSFSGSYNDLSNKPTIPAAVAVKGNAETNYRTGNVNITPANIGLGNVGNFKAVSTVASQGLTDTEKSNARANIGAGTSSFSGSYNDLSNKPTIPAAAANGTYTVKTLVGSTTTNVSDFTANQSSADDVTFVQGSNVTITPDATNRKITIAAKDTTYGVVSTSANGLAPKVTDTSKFLKGDGTWATPTNTDTKVTQTVTTTSANYEVLFSATADNTTRTEAARKNGNLKFNPSTGNLQVTQLNGVAVGSSPKFTDTTYSSKAAASGGADVSLCTTGEKYTWNNKLSASSFTNNNKGTSVEKIMVADASNGLGYSTPSDLASALGVGRLATHNGMNRGRNLNNLTETAIWFTNIWDGNWQNYPEQATCTTLVLNYGDAYIAQLFLGNNVYFRRCTNGSWSSWLKLNN